MPIACSSGGGTARSDGITCTVIGVFPFQRQLRHLAAERSVERLGAGADANLRIQIVDQAAQLALLDRQRAFGREQAIVHRHRRQRRHSAMSWISRRMPVSPCGIPSCRSRDMRDARLADRQLAALLRDHEQRLPLRFLRRLRDAAQRRDRQADAAHSTAKRIASSIPTVDGGLGRNDDKRRR